MTKVMNSLSRSFCLQYSAFILCYYIERLPDHASHHAASFEAFVSGGC